MAEFEIKTYGENQIMLCRSENFEEKFGRVIRGIPPTSSEVIFMEHDEIDELIKVLNDYANKRRNKEF